MTPRLIIEQKLTAFVNRYEIYSVTDTGERGGMVAFAQQRRLALKEKVEFYTDQFLTEKLFSFRAEKVMDIHGRYFVEDKDGKLIGMFRKDFQKSLLNSTWHILDANDKTQLIINESNQALAIIRRFGGFIPIVGEIIDIISTFFRYHFVFKNKKGEQQGKYVKTTLLRDHYRLEMTDKAYQSADWRVFAAMAVALDALQSR